MSHFYVSQTYIAASAELDEACAWLDGLGINFSRTRIGRYKALFASLAKHQQEGTLDGFYDEYTFQEWVNAAYEAAELVRMYEGLGAQNEPTLVARLRDALKGHELYVLDDNDRSGRDFSFELSIAAKFARAGLVIDFGDDADLKTEIDGRTFYVECKRIKSETKARQRVKSGLAQLSRRYESTEQPADARGILVVSIGKMVNSELGLLEAENSNALGEKSFAYNAAFIKQYRSNWQANVDQRTLGVAVVLDSPGILTSNQQLITCHEVTMNNCVLPNTPSYDLLVHVAHRVFPKPA